MRGEGFARVVHDGQEKATGPGHTSVSWILEHVLMPLVVTVVGVFLGLFVTIKVTPEWTSWLQSPSCADPKDLVPVAPADLEVASSPTKTPPGGTEVNTDWSKDSLTDRNTATAWVPEQNEGSTLDFTFTEGSVDLALLCVVNGKPSDEAGYQNAGKVRSLRIETDHGGRARISPLRIQAVDVMQQRQEVNFNEGMTTHVHMEVVDWYPGIDVVDPEIQRWSEATDNIALAEIEFYRKP
jgi:hypothetical protein